MKLHIVLPNNVPEGLGVDGEKDYSKNRWLWEICTILNKAGAGCVRHNAAGRVTDAASTAELRIVQIYHSCQFLLLSHDLTVKYF